MFAPVSRFFFRSISRKITVWLFTVVVMFCLLCVSSVIGLQKYKASIEDCELCSSGLLEDQRRRRQLALSFSQLLDPLKMAPADAEHAAFQRKEFGDHLQRSRNLLSSYKDHLAQLPPRIRTNNSAHVREWIRTLMMQLESIEKTYVQRLAEGPPGQVIVTSQIIPLSRMVEGGPETTTSVGIQTLKTGRNHYWWLSRAVYSCATIAAIVSICIFLFGYQSVFCRIRKVHRGARRVAQGDFDFRLEMNTDDEMGELANAFNQMTCRFQEIEDDLENQVRERSKMLVRSERLVGVGFLAAGVAHEINNPLQAVSMASESLNSRLDELLPGCPPSEVQNVRDYLGIIQTEARRVREITRKLLDFAGGEAATTQENDIVQIVSEVVTMIQTLRQFNKHTIDFQPGDSCIVEVNKTQIKQVVLNLIANALEAMKDGGHLELQIQSQTDQVMLQITDNGCGMDEETIDKLFEPFFTQKPVGQGTGLGMSITNRIVQNHGGTIEATSPGPGQGSTMRVRLPKRQAGVQMDAA